MFCRNCANLLDDKAVACTKCGVNPRLGKAFCQNCAKPTIPNAVVCVGCGVALSGSGGSSLPGADKKLPAGLCGILLGSLGVHKFILGYNTAGLIMLLLTVCTCGIAGVVMWVIGVVEGVLYLTKSDEEFVQTYIVNKKEWF